MAQSPGASAQASPSTRDYLMVGFTLFLLTVAEVAVLYIPALKPILVWLLVGLSLWKFILVILVFMHLRFDSKIYTGFFYVGMSLALIITIALVAMFAARGPNTSVIQAALGLLG